MLTADTITDEQIKWIWKNLPNAVTGAQLMDALGEEHGPLGSKPTAEEQRKARALCALAFNACTEGPPEPTRVHLRRLLETLTRERRYQAALELCDAMALHPYVTAAKAWPDYDWLNGFADAMFAMTLNTRAKEQP